MRAKKLFFTLLGLLFFSYGYSQYTVGNTSVDTLILATNLSTPWDVIYTEDSSIWFTERPGRVSRIDLSTGQRTIVLDHTAVVTQVSESGMLGMEIIMTTAIPKVFLVYTYRGGNNALYERLVRFDYDPTIDSLINENILIDSIPGANIHDGSRLEIVNNQLYMSTGDAANTNYSQDTTSLAGKILRLELNGGIPSNNPFAGSYIYSYGHRNAQGLFYANNKLYSSEHGPTNDDEINIIEAGRNYGWPNVQGFCNTSAEITFCNNHNVKEPLMAWSPTLAVCGICYYDHPAIPEFKGSILMTTLKQADLRVLKLNSAGDSITSTATYFDTEWGRLRDIETNRWGELFIATNGNPNRIIMLYNPLFTSVKKHQPPSVAPALFFPSPAEGKININRDKVKSIKELKIFDLRGKLIYHPESPVHTFSTSNFSPGVYIIEALDRNGKSFKEKVIIK
jgi:glucose/arabinose dehydrogenase